MTFHVINFNTDNILFNFDNLIIGRRIQLDNNSSKFLIYYQESEFSDAKEIYLKLPNIRLLYKLGYSKFNQEQIPIYPNYDLTNNFITFIKNLEDNIKECFIQKYPDIELNSIIYKKNNISYIKAYLDDNIKIITNVNNIKLTDLKLNNQIGLIIKINHIWNKNNKIGINSELFQLKYYPSPIELNINFFDNEQPIIEKISEPKIIQNKPVITNIPAVPLPIIRPPIPSIADLNNAIKKLKPASVKND